MAMLTSKANDNGRLSQKKLLFRKSTIVTHNHTQPNEAVVHSAMHVSM